MQLLKDIQHLTFITADMDRLIDFYDRIFDAKVVFDMTEEGLRESDEGLRHALIEVGPHSYLHPFQIPGIAPPSDDQPMFQRGRLDHFALNANSEEAFREMRNRLIKEDATDGIVTNMGALWVLTFSDPDEGKQELVWVLPDTTYAEDGLALADWTSEVME